MTVTILYFAWLKQKIGVGREDIDLPDEVRTVAGLISYLETRSPGHKSAFERRDVIRAAVDQSFSKPESSIAGAREIAFFPPVTGG